MQQRLGGVQKRKVSAGNMEAANLTENIRPDARERNMEWREIIELGRTPAHKRCINMTLMKEWRKKKLKEDQE